MVISNVYTGKALHTLLQEFTKCNCWGDRFRIGSMVCNGVTTPFQAYNSRDWNGDVCYAKVITAQSVEVMTYEFNRECCSREPDDSGWCPPYDDNVTCRCQDAYIPSTYKCCFNYNCLNTFGSHLMDNVLPRW
jgi:hypothetical protein